MDQVVVVEVDINVVLDSIIISVIKPPSSLDYDKLFESYNSSMKFVLHSIGLFRRDFHLHHGRPVVTHDRPTTTTFLQNISSTLHQRHVTSDVVFLLVESLVYSYLYMFTDDPASQLITTDAVEFAHCILKPLETSDRKDKPDEQKLLVILWDRFGSTLISLLGVCSEAYRNRQRHTNSVDKRVSRRVHPVFDM